METNVQPSDAQPTPVKKKKKSRILIIVAAVLAAAVLATVVIVVVNRGKEKEELTFGMYEQDDDTSNGKEPIEWIVLKKEGNRALLVSKYALDCQRFHDQSTEATWDTCTLRTWLNTTFLQEAFSEEEQARIWVTTVTAEKNKSFNTLAGSDVNDRVFLLSMNEANKYFASDAQRQCTLTTYAKDQFMTINQSGTTEDGVSWWLRTPGISVINATRVKPDGSVDDVGQGVQFTDMVVRPAIWITVDD